jgi:CheY-like chemotaxis protein
MLNTSTEQPRRIGLADVGSVRTPIQLRLLIVDGQAAAAESLALLLTQWGHEVHVCRTGPQALEVALDCRPDAVFADLVQSGMDGFQLAQCFQEQEELRGTVLIALTGLGDRESRRLSLEAGFALHLLRPLDPDEVQGVLTTLLQAKRKAT